jgi:cytolysin (calcineurin-like family phosphatase)
VRARVLVVCLSFVFCVACRRRDGSAEARDKPDAAPAVTSAAPRALGAAPRRKRRPNADVTFAVTSDTHFGFAGVERANDGITTQVNALETRTWPDGTKIARSRGLVITGDLTEWGAEGEWKLFEAHYGLDGGDGKPKVPVFEMPGNHDKVSGPFVTDNVARRHGGRFYAWDWDDLHLVALGEAPDDEGLSFLERDLDGLERDVPVALFMHFPLEGPFSTDQWFGDGNYRERLAKILVGHNIVAFFHGHHHRRDHYVWRGIDVFKPGAAKNLADSFIVARYTDTRLTVGWIDYVNGTWISSFAKELIPPSPPK